MEERGKGSLLLKVIYERRIFKKSTHYTSELGRKTKSKRNPYLICLLKKDIYSKRHKAKYPTTGNGTKLKVKNERHKPGTKEVQGSA